MERKMSIDLLKELIEKEKESIHAFFDHLKLDALDKVLQALLKCKGMIISTGVGKSGIIAKKIAFSMTSTGSRALFLSPTNALHGDFGIVHPGDVCLIFSKSGESDELLQLVPYMRNKKAQTIAIVTNPNSRLAKACDLSLSLPFKQELCPFDLAPTISTVTQMIIGDILTISLMRLKNFTMDDYAMNHPAGSIGKRMTMQVKDLMITDTQVPICSPDEKLVNTLVELSNKQCGCLLIVEKDLSLKGIFTDGDLRRSLQDHGANALQQEIEQLMTPSPKWITSEELAWNAMKVMEENQNHPITVLPVLEEGKKVVGIIKMHDIIQSGL